MSNSVDEEILKKHLISARYLNSIEKGEHALELAEILEDKIDQFDLQIPSYMILHTTVNMTPAIRSVFLKRSNWSSEMNAL